MTMKYTSIIVMLMIFLAFCVAALSITLYRRNELQKNMQSYASTLSAADTQQDENLKACLNRQEEKRQTLYIQAASSATTLEQQKMLIELAEKRYSEDKDTCFRLYKND